MKLPHEPFKNSTRNFHLDLVPDYPWFYMSIFVLHYRPEKMTSSSPNQFSIDGMKKKKIQYFNVHMFMVNQTFGSLNDMRSHIMVIY